LKRKIEVCAYGFYIFPEAPEEAARRKGKRFLIEFR
jgi:hypothetical protein